MAKYFNASERYAVEETRDMDPGRTLPPGAGVKSGIMTLFLTVHEPDDECQPHPSLPPQYLGYRVSPGCSFVTHEARARARTQT